MDIQQQFEASVARSKTLSRRPSNEELLELYALFKQATEGDVTGDRPGGFDFKAIAKFDAWSDQRGKEKDRAMKDYIALMERLQQQYS